MAQKSSHYDEIASNIKSYYQTASDHIHAAQKLAALLTTEASEAQLRFDTQQSHVQSILGQAAVQPFAANGQAPGRPRRIMSASARKRIANAQRLRWKAFHEAKEANRVKGSPRYEAQRAATLKKKAKR